MLLPVPMNGFLWFLMSGFCLFPTGGLRWFLMSNFCLFPLIPRAADQEVHPDHRDQTGDDGGCDGALVTHQVLEEGSRL